MSDEVYLSVQPIQTTWLRWLGYILCWGSTPVHASLYWKKEDGCYRAEMDGGIIVPNTEIVGKGDGYTIRIIKVPQVDGTIVKTADRLTVEQAVRFYANTSQGYLDGSEERDFYTFPQGYGGPMYDIYTCNTFISWVLTQSCLTPPAKPCRGAIGWGLRPRFPGPKVRAISL